MLRAPMPCSASSMSSQLDAIARRAVWSEERCSIDARSSIDVKPEHSDASVSKGTEVPAEGVVESECANSG